MESVIGILFHRGNQFIHCLGLTDLTFIEFNKINIAPSYQCNENILTNLPV